MNKLLSKYLKSNLNIPNILTLIRLILVPIYWTVFFSYNDFRTKCLIIFCIATITDFLDGYIARKHNLITDFGKLVDPLADKLMVVSVLVSHFLCGNIDLLPIILMSIKETILIIGAFIMVKKYDIVVYSNYFGKTAMVSFCISLVMMFFHDYWLNVGVQVDMIFVWISIVLSIISLIVYAFESLKKIQDIRRNK